jgi:hypothetical protein
MSTKIYYACRMPIKLLRPVFFPAYRHHVFKTAAKFVKEHLSYVTEIDMKAEWKSDRQSDKKLTWEKWQKERGQRKRLSIFFRRAVEASKSMTRDFECIDASVNVWLYKKYAYVIFYGEHWLYEDFERPEGVEDYCYWNNTDEPDDVTRRQWEARGKTWDQVCLNHWDEGRMVHEIIKADSTNYTGLFEVAKIIFKGDDNKATGAIFGI